MQVPSTVEKGRMAEEEKASGGARPRTISPGHQGRQARSTRAGPPLEDRKLPRTRLLVELLTRLHDLSGMAPDLHREQPGLTPVGIGDLQDPDRGPPGRTRPGIAADTMGHRPA